MREIKFKAFVKHLRWMLRVESIDFIGQMVEVDLTGGEGDTSWYTFEEAELIQFTGLKDKNGREIYEGDIITNPAWRNARFKVVFEAGMFRAVEGERKISLATFKGEVRCEIIGNIFENSDLLEVAE